MTKRCEYCYEDFDRPSFYKECQDKHKPPTPIDVLVHEIEDELTGRRGIGWSHCDLEIMDEIRDSLKEIIEKWLKEHFNEPGNPQTEDRPSSG